MNIKNSLFILFVLVLLIGCKENEKKIMPIAKEPAESKEMAKVPLGWVEKRVSNAKRKLTSTEAGKIVWNAMEAHGGLEKWYNNGPITFRFNYQPLDGSTPRDTYQAIDTWRSRARHYQAGDSTLQYGWNGEKPWAIAKDSTSFAYNTRFWSLTPYFFMAQPFVLDGDGVNLELLPQRTMDGELQDIVKVTFDAGTGDAPDDYYVLHFNTESHRLEVIRYIVSYPGYFEKGKHLPEKFMTLHGEQTVQGILFPESYKTHWLSEDESAGEHITDITLSDIEFKPELESDYFSIPSKAKIMEGL
ncbi:hypothetical protein HME9304_01022 [Flagellimonas maritima]|uniref:Uncharacterized protein n=1 Tax=Flagellimonas maritima TaxID=1383885 RepID=A0A2Z4LQH8_9FLAO|nr:hypothetical protein [Allomuricauda aurantiaca]AWX44022.1 hypothetical protein HME9304_01022 [Allomuricauda aurantiaca]